MPAAEKQCAGQLKPSCRTRPRTHTAIEPEQIIVTGDSLVQLATNICGHIWIDSTELGDAHVRLKSSTGALFFALRQFLQPLENVHNSSVVDRGQT